MNRAIYTYALIKSLYDQGHNYIDSFWPFAIKAIPANRFIDFGSIQKTLKENFSLEIPIYVIGTILGGAKRKGYIEQKKKEEQYKLTEEGIKYLERLESDKEVERRINALLEDLRQYFLICGLSLTIDQTNSLLTTFLRNNIKPLIEFINPKIANNDFDIKERDTHTDLLIEYIKTTEKQKPDHYKTLEEMILGSIISVILYSPKPSEIKEIKSKKFKQLAVYLDTNFIFSILEFHEPVVNKAAMELLNLLKHFDFELKVFSFTVNEICRVIGRYHREANCYPTSVEVDTIYRNLKLKGWTETTAKEFIVDVEKILSEKGMIIDFISDIDLKTFKPKNEGLKETIFKYKPYQGDFSQNHDLAAIEKIKEIRSKPVRQIERSHAIFLTSDSKLAKFNHIEMEHKANGTVCEVISDKLLANILWLKEPTTELPIKTIISAYSRDLFVKRRIWDKFYDVLKELKKEEKVDDDKISMLFYHKFIEDVLREFDETETDKITQEFVLEKIEEAAKQPDEEIKKQEERAKKLIEIKEKEFAQVLEEKLSKTIQEKDKEWSGKLEEKDKEWIEKIEAKENAFLTCIREEVAKVEQEKDKNWLEKLENIKKKMRESAGKSAKRRIWSIRILVSILLAAPFAICIRNGDWQMLQRIQGIFSIVSLIAGVIFGGVIGVWKKWEEKLSDKIYSKNINKLVDI